MQDLLPNLPDGPKIRVHLPSCSQLTIRRGSHRLSLWIHPWRSRSLSKQIDKQVTCPRGLFSFHSNNEIASVAKSKQAEYSDVHKKLTDFGVTKNPYSDLTPESLSQSKAHLDAAVDKRQKAYQTELARQRANDALCKVITPSIYVTR